MTSASAVSAPPASQAGDRAFVSALGLLSVSTGICDAVSYLGLDKVFTGNMTGNVLFLAFYISGDHQLHAVNLVVALACFLAGAAGAARVLRGARREGRAPNATFVVMGFVTALTLAIATAWTVGRLSPTGTAAVAGGLALALGAQAAALKSVGIRDISTVVITMTLVHFASEGVLSGRRDPLWARRVLAVVTMGFGALIGALVVLQVGGAAAVYLAGAVMLTGSGTLLWGRRQEDRGRPGSRAAASSAQ